MCTTDTGSQFGSLNTRGKSEPDTELVAEIKKNVESRKEAESKLLPFAAEASWATGKWTALDKYTSMHAELTTENFNVGIGRALLGLQKRDLETFESTIASLRKRIASSMSITTTSSLSACHDDLLKLHVLTELEMIAGKDIEPGTDPNRISVIDSLNRRLEVIGAYLNDKQYLLGIRRAAMQLSRSITRPQFGTFADDA